MKIIVNCIEHHIETNVLSYEDIVILAGEDPNRVYSVTFSHRQSGKQGLLYKCKSVTVLDGMNFSVSDTSNA